MSELEIPVTWRGKDLSFPARLQQTGYTHRIVVNVDGVEIALEPDEEKNYRAMLVDPDHPDAGKIDAGLIAAIVEVVQSVAG